MKLTVAPLSEPPPEIDKSPVVGLEIFNADTAVILPPFTTTGVRRLIAAADSILEALVARLICEPCIFKVTSPDVDFIAPMFKATGVVRLIETSLPEAFRLPCRLPSPVILMSCVADEKAIVPLVPLAEVADIPPCNSAAKGEAAAELDRVIVPPAPDPGALAEMMAVFETFVPFMSTLLKGLASA